MLARAETVGRDGEEIACVGAVGVVVVVAAAAAGMAMLSLERSNLNAS